MSDYVISLIRTWAPIIIGGLVSWLATIGIDLDPDTQAGLIVALTGVIQAAYYALARWLEQRFPWAGALLGARKEVTYTDK